MNLVIVESPTKAKALRGFLGRGYQVETEIELGNDQGSGSVRIR